MREVFRKLASALHPDREANAEQRAAKTALMHRVNQAYANNDLLTMLELQLQIEQADAGHMAAADSQRLKHHNKVLADQLSELHVEAGRVERDFRMDFGLAPGHGMKPLTLGELLERETQRQRQQDEALDMELFFRPSEW